MAHFVKGDVVVVPFPLSGADGSKRRPAIVLASIPFGSARDYLLCMVTTRSPGDPHMVPLDVGDIVGGDLAQPSSARPLYLFTVAENRILYRIGFLLPDKLAAIVTEISGAIADPMP